MRISDWSSDVCSSDLGEECLGGLACFCMGARGALPEAHAVLLIAHGPAEQALSPLVGEARGLLPRLDQDIMALQRGYSPRGMKRTPTRAPSIRQVEGYHALPLRPCDAFEAKAEGATARRGGEAAMIGAAVGDG